MGRSDADLQLTNSKIGGSLKPLGQIPTSNAYIILKRWNQRLNNLHFHGVWFSAYRHLSVIGVPSIQRTDKISLDKNLCYSCLSNCHYKIFLSNPTSRVFFLPLKTEILFGDFLWRFSSSFSPLISLFDLFSQLSHWKKWL